MSLKTLALLPLLASHGVLAYPWVASAPGVESSLLSRSAHWPRDDPNCPFNPNHVPAPLVTDEFPYNAARNGKEGNARGGYLVPAPGDTVHEFRAPRAGIDIRGPCPGLSTAQRYFVAGTLADVMNRRDG